MTSSLENFAAAQRIHQALLSDEIFMHGDFARGISFQGELFIEDIAALMWEFEGLSQVVVGHVASLCKKTMETYGGYIKISGSTDHIHMEVRGNEGLVPEFPSEEEIMRICVRRSAVIIDARPERTCLSVSAALLQYPDRSGRPFDKVVNGMIRLLSSTDVDSIVEALLRVATTHVRESGDLRELV